MGQMHMEIDGRMASVEALRHRALANYGHFTAMQIRDGRVRGRSLHLQRLESATQELFDADLGADRVRHLVRHALEPETSASVRVDVFQLPSSEKVSVMVTVRPPTDMPHASQKLQTVIYERPVAHIKHVGTFAQIYYARQAEQSGFDDALFVGPDGAIHEGTMTNIGFVDSDAVVWPQGPALHGITAQLLDQTLPKFGLSVTRRTVHIPDLMSFRAAFVTNSLGIAAVSSVDGIELDPDCAAMDVIREAYGVVPWDEI